MRSEVMRIIKVSERLNLGRWNEGRENLGSLNFGLRVGGNGGGGGAGVV